MITGCNTNIRHLGKLFHVQTEDSGREHPHIISHVYYGGTIIASEKNGYEDRIESADLDREVRHLIEEQHKTLLKQLIHGDFDDVIRERLGIEAGDAPAAPKAKKEPEDPPYVDLAHTDLGNSATGAVTGPCLGDTAPSLDAKPPSEKKPPADDLQIAAFGGEGDSEKPLDEVILEYLVEKARDRNAGRESRPSRTPRSKE
jgi:hypothetical protein